MGEILLLMLLNLYKLLGIKGKTSTPYNPQGNGIVERVNRTIGTMLRLAGEGTVRRDWPDLLPAITLAYRQAVHESTGYTPFMLEYGRELELPSVTTWNVNQLTLSARKLLRKLETCRKEATKILKKEIERRNARLEKLKTPTTFEIGNLVWYFIEQKGPEKFKWNWLGPAKIINKYNDQAYVIKDINNGKTMKINIRRLRKYEGEFKQTESEVVYVPNTVIAGYPINEIQNNGIGNNAIENNEENNNFEGEREMDNADHPEEENELELNENDNVENNANEVHEDVEDENDRTEVESDEDEAEDTNENEWTRHSKKQMTDAINGLKVQRGWIKKIEDLCAPRLKSYHKYRSLEATLNQTKEPEAKKQLVLGFVERLIQRGEV